MDSKKLRQDVIDELEFDPSFDAVHIGVAMEGGVATLSGHVSSYSQKIAAIEAARRVRGVMAVADEIEVRLANDAMRADDQIAQRAVNILGWDTQVPSNVQVTVRNGWVTLTGQVDWQYQRNAAEHDVRKLSGVIGVSNNITIRPRPAVDAAVIRQKIESALRRRAETEAHKIKVNVHDLSRVTLEGKVDNWDERWSVESAAWSVPGVTAVEDRLTIGV